MEENEDSVDELEKWPDGHVDTPAEVKFFVRCVCWCLVGVGVYVALVWMIGGFGGE